MEVEGRILFYNTQSGNGKLILKSGEKSDFFVDVWDDFDTAPEANQLVICKIEEGMITSIRTSQAHARASSTGEAGQSLLQKKEPKDNEETSDTKQVKPDSDEEPEEDIATCSVKEALHNYFAPIKDLIGKPPRIVNTYEQLDYFLSRRFLRTAYNNLKGIDPSLHETKEVKDSFDLLNRLDKAYSCVTEEIDIPEIAFEMIFLKSQPEYVEYIKAKEDALDKIYMMNKITTSMEPEIQRLEHQFKNAGNKKIAAEMEIKLKKLRGKYVDSIHEKATLTEKLKAMKNVKDIYTKKYYGEFKQELSQLKVEYQSMILRILNYKAYNLDHVIWKFARRSKFVQGYFKNASIQGGYSMITYLRYYLKTLDKEKIKDEQQEELFKLLEYLEVKEKER